MTSSQASGGNLGHDQNAQEAMLVGAHHPRLSGLERIVQPDARRLQRRNHTEEKARCQRESEGEHQNREIDSDFLESRYLGGENADKEVEGPTTPR